MLEALGLEGCVTQYSRTNQTREWAKSQCILPSFIVWGPTTTYWVQQLCPDETQKTKMSVFMANTSWWKQGSATKTHISTLAGSTLVNLSGKCWSETHGGLRATWNPGEVCCLQGGMRSTWSRRRGRKGQQRSLQEPGSESQSSSVPGMRAEAPK